MTQPLSGESSVLDTCFISDGFFLFQQREICVSSQLSKALGTGVTDADYKGRIDQAREHKI